MRINKGRDGMCNILRDFSNLISDNIEIDIYVMCLQLIMIYLFLTICT